MQSTMRASSNNKSKEAKNTSKDFDFLTMESKIEDAYNFELTKGDLEETKAHKCEGHGHGR